MPKSGVLLLDSNGKVVYGAHEVHIGKKSRFWLPFVKIVPYTSVANATAVDVRSV
mgnify:CR=1 FL=1